jgi:peptidoglycan/LPS O-acetylase OafA/YrhL
MDAIMTGCLLALTFDKWESILVLFKSKLSNKINVIYIIILFIFFIPSHYFILNVFHFNIDFILIPFGTRYGSISNILIAFLIVESIKYNDSLWFKTLNSKLFVYLGSISYSLYLWQQMFFSENLKFYSYFPINLVLIFVLANVSYYFIEKPFLKLKDK